VDRRYKVLKLSLTGCFWTAAPHGSSIRQLFLAHDTFPIVVNITSVPSNLAKAALPPVPYICIVLTSQWSSQKFPFPLGRLSGPWFLGLTQPFCSVCITDTDTQTTLPSVQQTSVAISRIHAQCVVDWWAMRKVIV